MALRFLACLTACTIGLSVPAAAQGIDLDASVGLNSAAWRAAVSSQWHYHVGSRLTVGTGLRLTRYGGEVASFRNVGTTTTDLPDRLPIDPVICGINVVVSAEARVVGSLTAGANLDLIGVAAGPSRNVGAAAVKPARGSLFQYGNSDRGSLNSEFFGAVALGPRVELRGGMSHYVVGYTATAGASATRYLRFEDTWFLAVRLRR